MSAIGNLFSSKKSSLATALSTKPEIPISPTSAPTPVAPTPSAPVPVPVAAVAPDIPRPTSADTLAAGVNAARTIAQRAGRSASVLTRQRALRATQTLAAGSGSGSSDYAAKTLG